jgi:protein gp37
MDKIGGMMNKTSIEWCSMTWNPVTGCLHNCDYCYARKIATRFKGSKAWPQGFEPMFHPERLQDPAKMKKPQTIFVCSMADLFGEWVPAQWIWDTFTAMDAAPQHTYIMLTKNPSKMARYAPQKGDQPRGYKENWWFGTTVTTSMEQTRIDQLLKCSSGNRFISFEPLHSHIDNLNLDYINQVIIGAQTNPDVFPHPKDVIDIENEAARVGAKVFCKDSLSYFLNYPTTDLFKRELCWQVQK